MNINMDTIVKDNDAHLRDKSAPVSLPLSEEDKNTLMELLTYVKESTDPQLAETKNLRPAVGIAAIQIGIPKQLLAVVVDEEDKNGNPIHYEYALGQRKNHFSVCPELLFEIRRGLPVRSRRSSRLRHPQRTDQGQRLRYASGPRGDFPGIRVCGHRPAA